jgi:hypothetical protein
MGTDIYFFVEYRAPHLANWVGLAEFQPPRDSNLTEGFSRFGKLRGIPQDYSIRFFERAFVFIAQELEVARCVGEKFCTEDLAQSWVSENGSSIYKSESTGASWVSAPEFGSTSWLSLSEFEEIFLLDSESRNSDIEYELLYAAMQRIEREFGAGSARVIFWFC